MHAVRPWFTANIAIAIAMFLASPIAYANTYQIYDLGDANGYNLVGIDTSGTVVIEDALSSIYSTLVDGMSISDSSILPVLDYDNGTSCTPALSSGMTVVGRAVCNGGYEVLGGEYLGTDRGIYTGPAPADFLQSGTVDTLLLNSSGDFAWTDGRDEENFEAIDLTSDQVPEPTSLFLVGTGLLAGLGSMRRRLL